VTTASGPQAPHILKLRGPGDLAEAIPHLLGFHPAASLVVVGLRAPRDRVCATLRADLAGPSTDRQLAGQLADLLARQGATKAFTAVYDDEPIGRGLPRRRLVREVERALAARGVEAVDAVLVQGGRWFSCTCHVQSCCPRAGTPLATPARPSVLATAFAVETGAPLPSREALLATVAADVPARSPEEVAAAMRSVATLEPAFRLAMVRGEVQRSLATVAEGPGPSRAQVVSLIALAQHTACRDEAVLATEPEDLAPAVRLWSLALRQAPPGCVAQVGALLGSLAFETGQGALARAAVDRALDEDPGHRLALLLLRLLDDGAPPLGGPGSGQGRPRQRAAGAVGGRG